MYTSSYQEEFYSHDSKRGTVEGWRLRRTVITGGNELEASKALSREAMAKCKPPSLLKA
jgi:hypothetical protein